MAHILNAYLITVREKGSKGGLLLGNFDGQGADLLKEFTAFFKSPANKDWRAPEIEAAARVDKVYEPNSAKADVIAAMVKSGETGLSSEFVEATEEGLGDDVAFTRGPNHAELIPVLILAKLPGTKDKGFLISHSPKGRGLKTKFWNNFQEWFGQRFPEHIVDLSRATPEGFYKKLIDEESLRRVTLVRYMKPQDMFDDDARWFQEDVLGKITTVLQPASRFARLRKKHVAKVVKGEEGADLDSLLVFQGEQYDEIRATFRDDKGNEHSIVLGENRAPRVGLDVTDKLTYDGSANPTYESLRQAALDYIDLLTP